MQIFHKTRFFLDRAGSIRALGKSWEGRLVPGNEGLLLYSSISSCTKANYIGILLKTKVLDKHKSTTLTHTFLGGFAAEKASEQETHALHF
jgi:hypothetical protein